MKKSFALFAIIVFALALSSCGFTNITHESELDYISHKADTDTSYYSALNIDVVSYLVGEGDNRQTQYEIQIGLRKINGDPILSAEAAENLSDTLCEETGLKLDYLGSYEIREATLGGEINPTSDYVYYCYKLGDLEKQNIDNANSSYGFFYIEHKYNVVNPAWLNNLRIEVKTIMENVLSPYIATYGYKIDNDAVNLRYYLYLENDFSAENAIWVYKTIFSQNKGEYSCLMWESDKGYDLTLLTFGYRSMAAGWYIIPIILGVAIVIIMFFALRNKKDNKANNNVFRQDEENEIKVTVLDGQISMYDLGVQPETAQEKSENSEDNNADKQ